MLRVEDGGVFGAEAEELGVELVIAVEAGRCGDVVAVGDEVGAFAGGLQGLLVQPLDALGAGGEIFPIIGKS